MTDLSEMAAAYPDLLTVRSCGTSLDGREIPEAILGNPESAHHILIQASIHAREYINTLVTMEQIEYFLHHHADGMYADASYDQLLSSVCFHILPMSNPDGVSKRLRISHSTAARARRRTHIRRRFVLDTLESQCPGRRSEQKL